MENLYFNPGCAWSLYKPEAEEKALDCLRKFSPNVSMHHICCHHDPQVPQGSRIVCICSGCHRRFNTLYEGVRGVTFWELIDSDSSFPFPDYGGRQMSVHDPCPVRKRPEVHAAVRSLLEKMNISVKETRLHGYKSVCCGSSFYGVLPLDKMHQHMSMRAGSMPCDDVAVYCVTCLRSMHIGGRRPHHILDLLFGEQCDPALLRMSTDEWYQKVEAMRKA
ncbi:MAG: hypothetical protein LBD28_04305 [Tannerellaceae bacterium]|jgi:Fe-S oxidoreductase|nr:hypothetical protein [Tannerellaceae bacterium]